MFTWYTETRACRVVSHPENDLHLFTFENDPHFISLL